MRWLENCERTNTEDSAVETGEDSNEVIKEGFGRGDQKVGRGAGSDEVIGSSNVVCPHRMFDEIEDRFVQMNQTKSTYKMYVFNVCTFLFFF